MAHAAQRKCLAVYAVYVTALLLLALARVEAGRTARLLHGDIITSRDLLLQAPARLLVQDDGGSNQQRQVWLVGLDSAHEAQVLEALHAYGGKLLHPLPNQAHNHWLVEATGNAIQKLLQGYQAVTAALMPDEFKVSPAVGAHVHGGRRADLATTASLLVLLPAETADSRTVFAQTAATELRHLLGSECDVTATLKGSLVRIKVCLQGTVVAANWAAAQPGVTWVDMEPKKTRQNLHANAVAQNHNLLHAMMDRKPAGAPPSEVLQGVTSGFFPLWQAGLTGKGQVVAIEDGGIDMDSCFFYDPHVPNFYKNTSNLLNIKTSDGTIIKHASDPGHRKVVDLIMVAGKLDTDGHGTHTAGTIAGAPYGFDAQTDAPILGTGICPDCKLAVIDGAPDTKNDENNVDVPVEVHQYLEHQLGARIASASLGESQYTYIDCFEYDQAAWGGSDLLWIFAAGNEGMSMSYLRNTNGTVSSQAICKNVVAVGATESWQTGDENTADKSPVIRLMDSSGHFNWALQQSYITQLRLPATDDQPGNLRISVTGQGKTTIKGLSFPFILSGSNLDFVFAPGFFSDFVNSDDYKQGQGLSYQLVLADSTDGCSFKKKFKGSKQNIMVLVLKGKADLAAYDNIDYSSPPSPPSDSSPSDYNYNYDSYGDYAYISRSSGRKVRSSKTGGGKGSAGGCTLYDTAQAAQDADANAVLAYWDDEAWHMTAFGDSPQELAMPMPMINKRGVGAQLAQLLSQGVSITVDWQYVPRIRPTNALPFENVASFSGYGNLVNISTKRIKPDLVAPGMQLSAYSDNKYTGNGADQCAVVRMQGTSMATPLVSGSAALVRQYFMDGFYPTGTANSDDSMDISAALLKAVLIAGTAAMTGYSMTDGQRLAPPPSPYQGYGRLDLSRSLPLADTPTWSMQVVDNINIKNGTILYYGFEVLNVTAGPLPDLIITLVWRDYPGYPGSVHPLVNDLDLLVSGPDGTDTNLWWGNGRDGGDRDNNVEKVYIANATPGVYVLGVAAQYVYVKATPQPFSLVVLGNIGAMSSITL